MTIKIGIIGKTNTGKTTFFNSATLASTEISTYPFTTKKPQTGTGQAITLCVHMEFNVQDEPNNSKCVLPESAIIKVKLGEKVKNCHSIIAKI